MSSAAIAPKPVVSAPLAHHEHHQTHGRHARCDKHARGGHLKVTVIAGGLLHQQALPRHARALSVARPAAEQRRELSRIRQGVQSIRGTSFNLTGRERTFACAAGTLFAAAALAAMIL